MLLAAMLSGSPRPSSAADADPQPAELPSSPGSACPLGRPTLSSRGELGRSVATLRRSWVLRILAVGSSTTAGVGASSEDKTYPEMLETELPLLHQGAKVDVEASGVSGETADQTLQRLKRLVGLYNPDLVIWQVGTNDALSSETEETFRAILGDGIATVREAGADLLLLDQQFFPSIGNRPRYERFVQLIKEAGKVANVGIVHRYGLMKAWNERSKSEIKAMLSTDGFHMSDTGHACVGRLLAEHIVAAIEDAEQREREGPSVLSSQVIGGKGVKPSPPSIGGLGSPATP